MGGAEGGMIGVPCGSYEAVSKSCTYRGVLRAACIESTATVIGRLRQILQETKSARRQDKKGGAAIRGGLRMRMRMRGAIYEQGGSRR